MSVRHLLAVAAVTAAVVAVPLAPSYASVIDPVTDLYVSSTGSDANDCLTPQNACLTLIAAQFKADATGTVIHVGPGQFDGPVRPGAFNPAKSFTIDGASQDQTMLTYTASDDFTVVNLYGGTTTTLSNLTVDHTGVFVPVLVDDGGHLIADHVTIDGGTCGIGVLTGGTAEVTDSTVKNGGGSASCAPIAGQPVSGDVGVAGGTVTLTRTHLLSPASDKNAVDMDGGSLTIDQSYLDDSAHQDDLNTTTGIRVQDGTATVTRSTLSGFDTGLRVLGGTATASDSTFFHNVVGATTGGGAATMLRSTFENKLGDLYDISGSLAVAGSVLGPVGDPGHACTGTFTDLGYNLATDASCGFTGTSHDTATGLNLDVGLADHGGPSGLPTVAILQPSSALDTIPLGTTYGDPATPLCPASGTTDLRGVPRPVGGACDAGSMEMAGTTTTVTGPATAKPHTDTTFDVTVDVPAVADALDAPDGTVTFAADGIALCTDVAVPSTGKAFCTTADLGAGKHHVSATFTPVDDSTIHGSTSAATPISVGTKPAIKGPSKATVRIGKKATITLTASGAPTPTFTVVSGKAPKGMTITKKAGKLTISGKAKKTGKTTLKVKAGNSFGSATHTLTITVKR